ncbi:MAG: hypothetical protein ABSG25_01625 [Bryobacteraceae bacterium]
MDKAKYEEKLIVINRKHLDNKRIPKMIIDNFYAALLDLSCCLDNPGNKYYVCNQDEPYAQKVIDIILKGENKKEKK